MNEQKFDKIRNEVFQDAHKRMSNTSRLDYETTLDLIHAFQEHILEEPKTPVIILDNPYEAWYAANLSLAGYPINQLKSKTKEDLENRKDFMVTSIPKFDGSGDFLVDDALFPFLLGSLEAYDYTFFDFAEKFWDFEYSPELKKRFNIMRDIENLGGVFPLENVCIVSEKPTNMGFNEENQQHNSNGPSYSYAGFFPFKQYHLNGVEVPEWLACQKSTDIDISRYNEITNADVKAEFVRKVGVERMLETGKMVDSYKNYDNELWTKSEYELWDLNNLFDNSIPYAAYLRMVNQTTGVWHVEAVSPECRTVPQAIDFRLGNRKLNIKKIA